MPIASVPFALASGVELLGEVIAWSTAGVAVRHGILVEALTAAELDPAVARELAPRHAFTRAAKHLSEQRIIRALAEDSDSIRFQLTAEHRLADRIEYIRETTLTLNKRTGTVTCDLPGLATLAQEHLDRAIEARTGSDVTRVIQRLFERHADLFPVRPQGGVYFVPKRHVVFVEKVQRFVSRINGQVLRFPVPAGTAEGDRSVKASVAAGLAALIAEHRDAVASFGQDTREDTLTRAADRIRQTRFKVEAYAELLADEKTRLDLAVSAARDELRAKVAALAAEGVPA
jgi:hypothetical protein